MKLTKLDLWHKLEHMDAKLDALMRHHQVDLTAEDLAVLQAKRDIANASNLIPHQPTKQEK